MSYGNPGGTPNQNMGRAAVILVVLAILVPKMEGVDDTALRWMVVSGVIVAGLLLLVWLRGK